MKKYRVKPYVNLLGIIRYGVYKRFFLIFWIQEDSFSDKQEAINYCDKLNEK